MRHAEADPSAADPVAGAGTPSPPAEPHADAPDLFHGGLLYRLMQRFGVDPVHAARAARRAALAAFLLWAPMAVAALLEGNALPGSVRVPFLLDVAAYVRPLLVIPLLLVCEPILANSWRQTGAFFRQRGIVSECGPEYEATVARVTRATRRFVPEALCAVLAALATTKLVATVVSAPRDAWFATTDASGATQLTWAGLWGGVVVHTILFYLTLRWVWLLSLWYRFLLGVARLRLHLFPAHPDRAGGLGFVGRSVAAGAPLAFAWSLALCSVVANRMIHDGAAISDFTVVGIVLLVFVLFAFVLPPALVFLPLLVRTRYRALEAWGGRMARGAEGDGPGAEPAASNLENLSIGVAAVRAMLPVPLALSHAVVPVAAAAVPAVALLFVAFPAKRIFDQIVRLLF